MKRARRCASDGALFLLKMLLLLCATSRRKHGFQPGLLTVRRVSPTIGKHKGKAMKSVAIINMTDEQLVTALGEVRHKIALGTVRFENSNHELRVCPFSAFNHTGAIIAARDSDDWRSAVAVQIKVESERRLSGNLASVKAGHQRKAETASVTVRTTGMVVNDSPVTVQLAEAQRLAERARKIGVEIRDRAERQAAADAITAAVEQAKAEKAAKANGSPALQTALKAAIDEALANGTIDETEAKELVEA